MLYEADSSARVQSVGGAPRGSAGIPNVSLGGRGGGVGGGGGGGGGGGY